MISNMDGVTILATEEILKTSNLCVYICIGIFLFCFIIGIILSAVKRDGMLCPLCSFIGIVIILIFLFIAKDIKVPTGQYKYKVIIDKNVKLIDFYDKYDVIEQDGLIFTVKERY